MQDDHDDDGARRHGDLHVHVHCHVHDHVHDQDQSLVQLLLHKYEKLILHSTFFLIFRFFSKVI